jgi:hypothetical protein
MPAAARGAALAAMLLALLACTTAGCLAAGGVPHEQLPPEQSQQTRTSANVVGLDAFSFYPAIADSRVWFIEFMVPWCVRACVPPHGAAAAPAVEAAASS